MLSTSKRLLSVKVALGFFGISKPSGTSILATNSLFTSLVVIAVVSVCPFLSDVICPFIGVTFNSPINVKESPSSTACGASFVVSGFLSSLPLTKRSPSKVNSIGL